ncbi:hypothetical protein [Streptantibioticus ferralitis]|uniref:Uncharacterized protein n=1 Tax=Streptantibioticus ferralitis TaxID=236510 RepID=A0ABT5YU88_9ACTN|nr:hypothetical protein [Streptantibioticus ferralitis]MDF2254994.1 hypothetical protein [Streptantibioticus ferralitis]
MLAVDVRQSLRHGETVEEGAARWWRFSAHTVEQHGDYLLAFVDGGVCVGAFEIRSARADEEAGGKYVFDLAPADRFQWALGRRLPLPAGRNPARILTGQALREFLDAQPRQAPATRS